MSSDHDECIKDSKYLGDGAYVKFQAADIYPMVIFTSNGRDITNVVYIEDTGVDTLISLMKQRGWL